MTNRELVMEIEIKAMMLKAKVIFGDNKLPEDTLSDLNIALMDTVDKLDEAFSILGGFNED